MHQKQSQHQRKVVTSNRSLSFELVSGLHRFMQQQAYHQRVPKL